MKPIIDEVYGGRHITKSFRRLVTMKKFHFVSLFLLMAAVFMLSTMFPAQTKAETYGDFTYELKNGGTEITITKYTGQDSAVTIPATINGASVTRLGSSAFEGNSLTSVVLPEKLTTIGPYCFRNCTNLTSLTSGSSINNVGASVFKNCPNLTVYLVYGTKMETYCKKYNIAHEGYATSFNRYIIKDLPSSVTYTGEAQFPTFQVWNKDTGATLTKDQDYLVEYKNNQNVGKATVVVTGIGNYRGSLSETFRITRVSLRKCKVSLSQSTVTYNGNSQTPAVDVTFNGVSLPPSDYTLSWSNNIKVGTATVTVTYATPNLSFSNKATFTINPQGTTIKKLKKGVKSFTVTWQANKAQTSGYEIQYSLKESFKGAKTEIVSSTKKTSVTIENLKAKKTYYVRIRTYKEVGSSKYYSEWSQAKKVKTK